VFGDTFTLHSGDTLVGDLLILGGTVTLEEGSVVTGNVVLVGGTLSIQGTVDKDLVALGGSPTIGKSALIKGDAVTIGSSLNGATDRVAGQIISNATGVFNIKVVGQSFPTVGVSKFPILWDFLGMFFSIFFMTTLAIGIVLFLPKQTERTARVLVQQPVAAGGMGCLTAIVAPIILIALAVTIIFSPVSVLGALLLVALVLFGWVAIGLEVGNRLALALHQNWHPAVSAGIGTFSLTLVTLGLSRVIICVGWMLPFVVSMVALGAVVLVFFGARQPLAPAMVAVQPAGTPPSMGTPGPLSGPAPVAAPSPAASSPASVPPAASEDEIPPAS
jgi:hypothetical protein